MAVNEQNMKEYYGHIYPVEDVVNWVSYRNCYSQMESNSYLARREFCFTLIGDIFTRHRSYTSAENLRSELVKKFPEKIDVGAIYNISPEMKKVAQITAQERELVFDIDMSDYDSVRSCCKGKKVCNYCWPWMSTAAFCLKKICEEDFGFKYLIPVFSGRRGIHLWVCDRKARKMSDEERSACVGYMTVVEGENKTNIAFDALKKDGVIHPTMEEVDESFLAPTFEEIFLSDPNSPNHISNPDPAKVVYAALSAIATHSYNKDAKALIANNRPEEGQGLDWSKLQSALPAGVLKALRFALLYPRLDEHVSTRRDHLLKLPFCVHPGTGKLCTPLMWETLAAFRPTEDPPSLEELLLARSIDLKWKRPLINMMQDMAQDSEEFSAERAEEEKGLAEAENK